MHDLRLAFRSLSKSPGFTAIALLTLAVGIGLNTAMFSLVNTLLFGSAPYPNPSQLVRVFRTSAQSQTLPLSLPDITDLQQQSQTLASLTAFQWWAYSYSEPGQPAEHMLGIVASANLFTTLGVQPMLGRGFTPEEQQPGRDRVVVLSHAFWQRRFGGDPQVVGRSLRVDYENVLVVGVMPASADYPVLWGTIDLWRPLPLLNDWRQERSTRWLNAMARIKPGIAPSQAQAELSGLSAQLAQQYPAANAGAGHRLIPLVQSITSATERNLSWFALGLSGFVLLIACANLANLQLARTAERGREFAIRAALGASRARLGQQLVVESLLLSVVGGVLGLILALWINDGIGRLLTIGGGRLVIPLDYAVLGFALLASLGTGVLFGTVPAWIASRADVNAALKQQSRGSTGDRSQQKFRSALIIGEVALALVLLSGASFFIRGLQRYMDRNLGWQTSGLLSGTITLPANRYDTPEQRRTFYRELERRLPDLVGVERAAIGSALPIAADRVANNTTNVFVEGRPIPPAGQAPLASFTVASPGYFATLQIPLVAGRLFAADLRPDAPRRIVVNEAMARQLWPGENPIGKRISGTADRPQWEEVIGVVRDVGFAAYAGTSEPPMQFYRPLVNEPWGYMTVVLRGTAPEALAEPLRRVVAALDPDLAVTELRTVRQAIDDRQNTFYLINRLLGIFAFLGLCLSAIGLYGVIARLVVQRLPEFGIRMALGATPGRVLHLVLGQGLRLAVIGMVVGLAGGAALVQVLSSLLPGFPGQDTVGMVVDVLLLLFVAVCACWLPARRATRVNPIDALRAE